MTRQRRIVDKSNLTQQTDKLAGNNYWTHPENKDAVFKFSLVSALLLILPIVLYLHGAQYEWSIDTWGFITVIAMNIIMGCYAYIVYIEENGERKESS